MTELYDRQPFREPALQRGHIAEVIEFHPGTRHVDPVVIFDREMELFDDLSAED